MAISLKDRVEEIIELDGKKMLKITANKGLSVDFKPLPEGYVDPGLPTGEVTTGQPDTKTDSDWKYTCAPCDFASNDEDLYQKHNKSKAHKEKIAASGA